MSRTQLIAYFCTAVIVFCAAVGSAYVWSTSKTPKERWSFPALCVWALIAIGGTYSDVRIGFLAVGFAATFMAEYVPSLWATKMMGPEGVQRFYGALRESRNRQGFVVSRIGSIIIRSSPGVLMVWSVPREHSLWWLGVGVILSAIPSLDQMTQRASYGLGATDGKKEASEN